ncbi:MAG TPA: hypothetical protein PK625_00990 [Spirochaetales bacterium]|nr:hypothetical protein [Spirochaetales bacterium]
MKKLGLLGVSLVLLIAGSCSTGMDFPEGAVTLKDVGQRDESGARYLVIQYAVSNVSPIIINASTVSFSASTGSHGYFFTAASSLRIVPGATIYLSAETRYLSETETVDLASVKVASAFFE